MAALSGGRGWLNDNAAASIARLDRALDRTLPITSAGRTVSEQQALINRWNAGGKYNRPPYLYKPAMPAAASPHVAGNAIDTPEQGWMLKYGGAHGWTRNIPTDLVHFVYNPAADQFKGSASGAGGNATPINNTPGKVNRMSYSFILIDGGPGVYVMSHITGLMTGIGSEYHLNVLRRARDNDGRDNMLSGEIEIVRQYLSRINPGLTPGDKDWTRLAVRQEIAAAVPATAPVALTDKQVESMATSIGSKLPTVASIVKGVIDGIKAIWAK